MYRCDYVYGGVVPCIGVVTCMGVWSHVCANPQISTSGNFGCY